jgi:futalosine hydrolase
MSSLLIVSATNQEILPILNAMAFEKDISPKLKVYRFLGKEVVVLITGVGMVATAFELGKALSRFKFEFVLNLGIAGSFDENIKKGDVVNVVADCFADLGAQDGNEFISLSEMGLMEKDSAIFKNGWLVNEQPTLNPEIEKLSKVIGISVNQVHGEEHAIEKVVKRLNPAIESMEGAAFFYACLSEGVPCAQIRAVSNVVERRNRENWNIPLAISNLNETGLRIIKLFS